MRKLLMYVALFILMSITNSIANSTAEVYLQLTKDQEGYVQVNNKTLPPQGAKLPTGSVHIFATLNQHAGNWHYQIGCGILSYPLKKNYVYIISLTAPHNARECRMSIETIFPDSPRAKQLKSTFQSKG